MVKVGLLGWFGGGNSGDEIMPYAIIHYLQDIPKINKIFLFSRKKWRVKDLMTKWVSPKNQKKIKLIPCQFYSIWNPLFFLEILDFIKQIKNKKIDILLIGGGGLLKSYQSNKIIPDNFMSQWLIRALLAKLTGVKVVFFGIGVGKMTSIFDKLLAKMVLLKVDLITVRDNNSIERLKVLGIKDDKISITADLAWLLGDIKQKKSYYINIRAAFEENESMLVGICPRPLYQMTKKDTYFQNKLEKSLIKLIKFLIEKYNSNILLFTLKSANYGECEMIEKIYRAIERPRKCFCMFSPYPPFQYMKLSKQFDIMIGIKFHSLIFAAISETPFIGISYDEKIDSFFDYMNLSEYKCNPYSNSLTREIITKTEKLIQNKDKIMKYLSEKKLEKKKEALKNFDILYKYMDYLKN